MDDVSDEILSQFCEGVEFTYNLPAADDIILSQACMDEEYVCGGSTDSYDVSELVGASSQPLLHARRDMQDDGGGCGIMTGWNYPSKRGNSRITCLQLDVHYISLLT